MITKDYLPLMQEAGAEGGAGGSEPDYAEEVKRLLAPDGSFEDTDNDDEGGNKGDENKQKSNDDSSEEFTPSKDWDIVKDLEGFSMPSDITKDNEAELLKGFIAKKYGIEADVKLHPLARQIQQMAEANPSITINDIVNSVSEQYVDISKMSDDEKIAFDMYARYGRYDETSNKDGIEQSDIDDFVNKLTKIEKKNLVQQIEKNIEAYNGSLTQKFQEQQKEAFNKNYDKIVETIDTHLKKLETNTATMDKVYGIPVSQDDHKNYLEEFKRSLIPNKETGLRDIDVILSDDETLYKMFLLSVKFGEDKVIETITKGRESGKEELLKKLGITPRATGTSQRAQEPNSFEAELDLLRRPATI